jgi:hypothetical protein
VTGKPVTNPTATKTSTPSATNTTNRTTARDTMYVPHASEIRPKVCRCVRDAFTSSGSGNISSANTPARGLPMTVEPMKTRP